MSVVRPLLAAAVCCLALAGCGDDGAPGPTEETTAVDESSAEPTSPAAGSPTPVPATGPVADAVTDLASSLGVDPGQVEVVAVEEVTWRDGSRGCAKKGVMYTQALIDGSRITLRVGDRTYEYHAGGSGKPFLCETPTQ